MKRSFILPVLGLFILISCKPSTQSRAPVTHYGLSQGAGSAGVHTVSRGDTLYSIAQRYNIVMRDIAIGNNLHAPFELRVGQRLKLPPPLAYRVRAGDSLYTVSRLFGVSTSEVAKLNNLPPPYVIRAGQTLRLPSVTRKTDTTKLASVAKPAPKASLGKPTPAAVQAKPQVSAQVKQAKAKITAKTPKRSSSKFMKPVEGPVISTYGPKKDGLHNDGINIKAARGTPVLAAENGVVVYAGSELKGSGNLILIRHEDRWMTAYAHMDRLLIQRGQTIKRGQTIGTVGATGSVDSPQLHFEVRRGTEAINPSVYLEG